MCGRRWGKSRLALYTGLMAAMRGLPDPDNPGQRVCYDYSPESPPVVVFAMPTLVQCKKIFWKPLLNLLSDHPTVASINKSDYTIKFVQPRGGAYYRPDIVCLGLNDQDGDRVRGLRLAHINCDEFQDVKRGIFDEVIVPALADTPGSTALITGTPKGKVNHLHDFYLRSEQFEDWRSFHYVTLDNDKLPPDALREIERSKRVLTPRVFRQEHEASFEDFPGQIFDHLDPHHRVAEVPTQFDRVLLGVDWGDVNPALSAVGVTRDGAEDHYWILDFWYSDTGQNVLADEFLQRAATLVDRWGIRHVHCGHDRPASIEVWNRSLRKAKVAQAFTGVSEGNNAINGLLFHNRLKFRSPDTDDLWEEMAAYHRKQDRDGNFMDDPAPNQQDHATDATRYAIASDIFHKRRGTMGASAARFG
ncbi:MAG: terminase large subunit domain-containing protein [Aquiluna sp.]